MASFNIANTVVVAQSLAADEPGIILASGSISMLSGDAVTVTGGFAYVTNLGSIVSANSSGIDAGTFGTGLTIQNSGTISGQSAGIASQPNAFQDGMQINNTGLILGSGYGIICQSGGNVISNTGTISSMRSDAISIIDASGLNPNLIVNAGLISNAQGALAGAVILSADVDTVINTGRIVGEVDLGGNADIFDGRGGVVSGIVRGGAGSDIYRISDASIVLQEDAGLAGGVDLVESTVSYALASNFEKLTLLADALAGIGNGLANTLVGNNFDNRLTGLAGNDAIGGVAGDDLLRGGDGNDGLYGGLGDDILRGGNGNDILRGGAGADSLIGGQGADQFDFDLTAESRADEMDRISLFARGQDDINLTTIDANTGVALNQNFAFIGAAAFTAAGQVRIVDLGANVRVEVNTTGVAGAEMVMMVLGVGTLTGSDFIL